MIFFLKKTFSENEEQKKQWLIELQKEISLSNLSPAEKAKQEEKMRKEKFLLDNSVNVSKSVIEELAKTLNGLGISDRTGDEGSFFFIIYIY